MVVFFFLSSLPPVSSGMIIPWTCALMTTWTSSALTTLAARSLPRRPSATCFTWWSWRTMRTASHIRLISCAGSVHDPSLLTRPRSSPRSSSALHHSLWAKSFARARVTTISVSVYNLACLPQLVISKIFETFIWIFIF